MRKSCLIGLLGAGLAGGWAGATGPTLITYSSSAPVVDRWMYPFSTRPCTELQAPIFSAPFAGFDDRDAELLLGFRTSDSVPAGLERQRYKILGGTVTVTVANDLQATYNPNAESWRSALPATDPRFVPKIQASGWPIEIFGVGYRNGFNEATNPFQQCSAFGGAPVVPPAQGARNAFVATFDSAGNATDLSNQLKQGVNGEPMAIGLTNSVSAGAKIPSGTTLSFDLAGITSSNRAYLQRSLARGRVMLAVSSLEPTTGGPGGGTGGVTYPILATTRAGFAEFNPSLTLLVAITCAADFNADGVVDTTDFVRFVASYNELLDAEGDLNDDGQTDQDDFLLFVVAYNEFLCP